jgi:hypothetical protein
VEAAAVVVTAAAAAVVGVIEQSILPQDQEAFSTGLLDRPDPSLLSSERIVAPIGFAPTVGSSIQNVWSCDTLSSNQGSITGWLYRCRRRSGHRSRTGCKWRVSLRRQEGSFRQVQDR